jgi:integrase
VSLEQKPSGGSRPTFQIFSEEIISYVKSNYSPSTFEVYSRALTNFKVLFGNVYLDEITAEHFDKYKARRLGAVKPNTVNQELRTIRAALFTACRWKRISSNPFSKQKFAQQDEQAPVFLSQSVFTTLVSSIDRPWFKDLVVFAAVTGMRRGEIVHLKRSDVDLDRRLITVQSSSTYRTKQGKKRIVPLSEIALNIVLDRSNKELSEYVFSLDGRRIKESFVTHLFKKYVVRSKLLDQRIHFHSLRHYAESRTMPSEDADFSRSTYFPLVNSA